MSIFNSNASPGRWCSEKYFDEVCKMAIVAGYRFRKSEADRLWYVFWIVFPLYCETKVVV